MTHPFGIVYLRGEQKVSSNGRTYSITQGGVTFNSQQQKLLTKYKHCFWFAIAQDIGHDRANYG